MLETMTTIRRENILASISHGEETYSAVHVKGLVKQQQEAEPLAIKNCGM